MSQSGGEAQYVAFQGDRLLARGPLSAAALAVLQAGGEGCLVFSEADGGVVDLDLRGGSAAVAERYAAAAEPTRGRGRPKLGVVAREVTLLPRHWDWLAQQSGGASVALRRLVETARKADAGEARAAQAAAWRFLSALSATTPGLEEAGRALFAGDRSAFEHLSAAWPQDVRHAALRIAAPAFAQASQ